MQTTKGSKGITIPDVLGKQVISASRSITIFFARCLICEKVTKISNIWSSKDVIIVKKEDGYIAVSCCSKRCFRLKKLKE